MRYCLTLLLAFVLSIGAAAGQVISNPLENLVNGTDEVQGMPDPLELNEDWWSYFEVEGPELKERIETVRQQLDRILEVLGESDRRQAEPLVTRVIANLKALQPARNQPEAVPYVADAMQESYSLDELLEVRRLYSQAQDQLLADNDLIKQVAASIRNTRVELANQRNRYEGLEATSVERLLLGLELMGNRSALALVEEKQRLYRAAAKRQDLLADGLQEELEFAQENLELEVMDPDQLLAQIQRAQLAWESARRRAFQAEADSVTAIGDTPVAQSNALRLAQQAIFAKVQEGLALVSVLDGKTRHRLAVRMGSVPQRRAQDLGTPDEWDAQLRALRSQLSGWAERTGTELNNAQQTLSKLGDVSNAEDVKLQGVTQRRIEVAQQTQGGIQQLELALVEVALLQEVLEQVELRTEPTVARWFIATWGWVVEGARDATAWLREGQWQMGAVNVTPLAIIQALLILLVALWLSSLTRAALSRAAVSQWGITKSSFYTLNRLIHYLILSVGFFFALSSIGLDLSTLAIVFGALSVGIGFGLQGIVNDFLSGLIILFEAPLRVGDYLEIESELRGRVTAIKVRSTHIRTNDGLDVVVPNSQIISGRVTNWTMSDAFRRIHVPFGVAYGTDKELVKKAALEAADRVETTLKGVAKYGEPEVWLVGFGDSSVDFELIVWVNAYASKRHARTLASYYWELHSAFERHGVTIPFPQRDVWIRQDPEHAPQPQEPEKV